MTSLARRLVVAASLVFLSNGAAFAQSWGFVSSGAPRSGAPLALASIRTGDPSAGWKLVAWCERAGVGKVNWQIRIQTRDIISAYHSADVTMRFDDRRSTRVAAPLSGDYSNVAVLARSEEASPLTLQSWLEELKSSRRLAVQIGKVERVFPMDGASRALSSWADHCRIK